MLSVLLKSVLHGELRTICGREKRDMPFDNTDKVFIKSFSSQIVWHNQWWPSIEQMTWHQPNETKAMCQKVAETKKAGSNFLLALYADYRMSVL